jgi:hypothetical protein
MDAEIRLPVRSSETDVPPGDLDDPGTVSELSFPTTVHGHGPGKAGLRRYLEIIGELYRLRQL